MNPGHTPFKKKKKTLKKITSELKLSYKSRYNYEVKNSYAFHEGEDFIFPNGDDNNSARRVGVLGGFGQARKKEKR
jgi:hypothetical protein